MNVFKHISWAQRIVAAAGLMISAAVQSPAIAQSEFLLGQPTPTVKPVKANGGPGKFRVSNDKAIPAPNHPPIDTIPPIPFPSDKAPAAGDNLKPAPDLGPGGIVGYDAEKGIATPGPKPALPDDLEAPSAGDFRGADGGGGTEREGGSQRMNGSMTVVADPSIDPWRRNVKLVMRFQNAMGQNQFFSGSGVLVDAETVLTAGHCVNDSGGLGWAKEIWVYPGWDGVGGLTPEIVNPYGAGNSTQFYAPAAWVNNRDFNYDLGAVVITRAVGMLTGWFGYSAAGDCNFHLSQTYNNASYPAESCAGGLHTGTTMYYWFGAIDDCVGNRFFLETSAGCTNAIWGGQSGSGLYYVNGSNNRIVSAVTSTSDRATFAYFARLDQSWVNDTTNTIIPAARGTSFDLQPLEVAATPGTVTSGDIVTIDSHLATNATNGAANKNFSFGVYLSSNSSITSSDTFLGQFDYDFNFAALSNVLIGPVQVEIPEDTPTGDYYLGVLYDDGTDGNNFNNATNTWDAFLIHVNEPVEPPPPPCTCPLTCTVRAPAGVPAAIRDTLPAGIDLASFLHQYRDQVMAQSPLGRRYVSLYYEHSPELSRLITQRPAVARGSTGMLVRVMPNILSLMEGGNVELGSEDRRAAIDLIELVHVHASPELRTALAEVRADLSAGRLDRMFSDDLASTRTVIAAAALRWTGIGLILSAGLMAMFWRRRSAIAA